MDKLFTLLEVQHKAQEAQSRDALLHIIANDTLKIIPYTQAVFFSPDAFSLTLERISGNTVVDPQSLYVTDIKKFIKATMKDETVRLVSLEPATHKTNGAILFFRTGEEGLLGILWMENTQAYSEAEQRILEELSTIYAQCLALWNLRKNSSFLPKLTAQGKWTKFVALGFLVLVLLPVRLTISAPAEIVAKEAEIITVPFDGMIEKIEIEPGDTVKTGDLLVTMESQSLQAQMDLAQQEILIAQSALSRMQRESLTSPEKKMNLVQLQEEIESKKISSDYAKNMKERSEIRAAHDGIAVFSGSHPLEGKPVHTGEKIMTIADPANYELLIRVPVDSMVAIANDADTSFFLNISPFGGHDATIRSIGYQASIDADGLMTYKILAELPDKDRDMRIGWKGTAHIKGQWTVLSYAILRRPVITLRNVMGL